MARYNKNTLQISLAQYFIIKKFNFFLFSAIAFTIFSFSVSAFSVFIEGQKSKKILGVSIEKSDNNDFTIAPQSEAIITPIPTRIPIKRIDDIKKVNPTIIPKLNSDSRYTSEKIGKSTYRIADISGDTQMALANEIFDSLNNYRRSKGRTTLNLNAKLTSFAQVRADFFASIDNLDSHKGFIDFMHDHGFEKLGFNGLGENSAILSVDMRGERIIKEIFGADSEHDNNQIEASWEYVGIGVKDKSVDIIFGKNKR